MPTCAQRAMPVGEAQVETVAHVVGPPGSWEGEGVLSWDWQAAAQWLLMSSGSFPVLAELELQPLPQTAFSQSVTAGRDESQDQRESERGE